MAAAPDFLHQFANAAVGGGYGKKISDTVQVHTETARIAAEAMPSTR